jgi:hypothetical protein
MNYIAWQNAFASTAFSAHGTIAVTFTGCDQQSVAWHQTRQHHHITFHMNHSSRFMFKPPVKVIPFPTKPTCFKWGTVSGVYVITTNWGSFWLPFQQLKKHPALLFHRPLNQSIYLKTVFLPLSKAQFARYFGVTLFGGKSTSAKVWSCASNLYRFIDGGHNL